MPATPHGDRRSRPTRHDPHRHPQRRLQPDRSGGGGKRHGVTVARVPAYSPNAVSEFTLAMILTLGRKTHKAYNRSREFNFEIAGLEGFELRDKTVGVFGTGKIGQMVIQESERLRLPHSGLRQIPQRGR
jgi:phosphoglycerate dehydrogenase-like enzyme